MSLNGEWSNPIIMTLLNFINVTLKIDVMFVLDITDILSV